MIAIEVSSELYKNIVINQNRNNESLERKKRQYGEVIGYYPYSYYGYVSSYPLYREYSYPLYGYPYHFKKF
ncbi:Hypothetical protein SRAE_2000492500 [Strongyloides ratti]|uniref:Uncharacterized protein n=1 Tax=Strongyloides ratti TaxID=34506 RepID=A0A090LKG5_STRRB|nr:Hypothetical protein SRAE_2000492500 [Strongyloides ratti]CEF70292.1 Hypothetical protein SRAE_2000492500 [Strongyloides ratti]